jgi:hypothetical protein
MFDTVGGRRFALVLLCSFGYTALLVGGYMDQGSYVALQMMTVGAYLAANGAQKYTETRYGNGNGTGPADKAG